MRKLLSGAAFFSIGVFAMTAHAANLNLQGSDTLEEVTKDAISICSFNTPIAITYVGGGSGTGEGAMTAVPPTQLIAPMSRELTNAPATCKASSSQLLIGLDGIAIVAANQLIGDSLDLLTPGDTSDDCSDAINGGQSLSVPGCTAADGCTTPGTYTFTDWKDVLAMVYGGQNHTAAAQLVAGARNPARINCAGAVRQALVNNWATIFNDSGTPDIQSCRTDSCLKLKHAFRRADASGTTDTFVTLVGLAAIPPYTTTFASFLPTKDTKATANPFCNAGEALMNKGDSDYLDLDPIRRIADSDSAATGRVGLEQVAQGYVPASNPPTVVGVDDRVEPPVTVLADYTNPNEPNLLPDPAIANAFNLQKSALALRRGLGVVLVIEIPTNFNDERIAYYSTVPQFGEPVLCTVGKFAPTFIDTGHVSVNPAICPDGRPQPCLFPVNLDNPTVANFNCLSNTTVPALPPIRDNRVYNLMVVDQFGKVVRDGYKNPNLSGLSAARQARVVSAFFRLHLSRTTNLGGAPTGINCKKFSATEQIGCLVTASPCSIGFAGRESVDSFTNMAFQVGGVRATADNISNLVNGSGLPKYPISRGLWLNSIAGFSSVGGDQQTLIKCFEGLTAGVDQSAIDAIVESWNFVSVPPGVTRLRGCPSGL